MKKKTIYFAHPFETMGTKDEKEIIALLELCGFEVIDPFEDEKMVLRKYGVENYYDKPNKMMASEIFRRDFEHVMTCDELFAWFPNGSPAIGTAIELGWAYDADKYTYVLSPIDHPFLLSMADFFYNTYEDMIQTIKEDALFGKV